MPWLLSKIYDALMRGSEEACLAAWRADLLAEATGDILEIGAGTGANLPHYRSPRRLVLAEPDRHMRRRLARRLDETGRAAEIVDASADALPFAAGSFDGVVATLVLCSVDDQGVTLGEIRRVLRPAGRLFFLEHVAADD